MFKSPLSRILKLPYIKSLIAGFILAGMTISGAHAQSDQGNCRVAGNGTQPICEHVTIDRLMVLGNGNIYVATSADESDLADSCTALSGRMVILTKNTPGRERMLAVLLTAHERRRPLRRLRLAHQSAGCTIDYVWSDM